MQRTTTLATRTLLTSMAAGLLLAGTARAEPTPARRVAAARAAAETSEPCRVVQPFYWSIGDAQGVLEGGGVGRGQPDAPGVPGHRSGEGVDIGAQVGDP